MKKQLTFGLIVGNRGFFPDHLAKEGREEMLGVLGKAGIRAITLAPEQSKFGSVETHDDFWYQKPIVWASMIAVVFVVLNVIF
ncbi:MAG: hypothetical protein ABSA94_17885, partial [Acidobacteriaceae bacterium]